MKKLLLLLSLGVSGMHAMEEGQHKDGKKQKEAVNALLATSLADRLKTLATTQQEQQADSRSDAAKQADVSRSDSSYFSGVQTADQTPSSQSPARHVKFSHGDDDTLDLERQLSSGPIQIDEQSYSFRKPVAQPEDCPVLRSSSSSAQEDCPVFPKSEEDCPVLPSQQESEEDCPVLPTANTDLENEYDNL